MSPEQIEGKEADARSDIFALGATLYEMATGVRAFEGKSQLSVASAILEKDPEAISKVQPLAPAALDRLLAQCLAKNPDERFQCAADVALELKWISQAPRAPVSPPAEELRVGTPALQTAAWGVAAAGVLAAIILGSLWLRLLLAPSSSVHAYILPPDKATFDPYARAAISPDGRRIAFGATGSAGRPTLWVQPLNSGTAQPLAGTEGATYPFWSADSRYLGYFADGKLNKIDASGGPPQALCDAPTGRGGTWSQEGIIVFASDQAGPLMRGDAAGGTPVEVTVTESGAGMALHRLPWFLPDGKHFLYFSTSVSGVDRAIYAGALGSKEQVLVLHNDSNAIYAPPGYLLFVRDGTLMAQRFNTSKLAVEGDAVPVAGHVGIGRFSVSGSGVLLFQEGGIATASQLIWFDSAGNQIELALPETAQYSDPMLSPDGSKLAVTIADSPATSDIWVIDLARKTQTRITFGPGSNRLPVWWPDGRSIVFGSNRDGGYAIYRRAADGSGADEKVLETPGSELEPYSVSPDGRYIAYQFFGSKANANDVWALPMFGDRKPFPVVSTPFNEVDPAISPDGKWVAYLSNDTGQYEVYIKPFPSGEGKWQVSTTGSRGLAVWRSDGKELYFLSVGGKLTAVEVREKGASLELGTPQELFQANTFRITGTPFAASADGKRFLINGTTAQAASQPLTLVTNWTADLKK